MRALIDANVLVSAALARHNDRTSLSHWLVFVALLGQRRFELVTSHPLLRELFDAIVRQGIDESTVTRYIDMLSRKATIVPIYRVPMGCPDPDDDKVLETAMNANADFIVTRDRALFTPQSRWAIEKTGIGIRGRPIRVVGVRTFVDELSGAPRFSPLVVATLAA